MSTGIWPVTGFIFNSCKTFQPLTFGKIRLRMTNSTLSLTASAAASVPRPCQTFRSPLDQVVG